MVAAGKVLPTVEGMDMKHVSLPPDADTYRAAEPGSIFVEFDVIDAQISPGGNEGWVIIFGPNSTLSRLAAQRGLAVTALPRVENIIIRETR